MKNISRVLLQLREGEFIEIILIIMYFIKIESTRYVEEPREVGKKSIITKYAIKVEGQGVIRTATLKIGFEST